MNESSGATRISVARNSEPQRRDAVSRVNATALLRIVVSRSKHFVQIAIRRSILRFITLISFCSMNAKFEIESYDF